MTHMPQILEKVTLGSKFLKLTLHVTPTAKNRSLKYRDVFFFLFFRKCFLAYKEGVRSSGGDRATYRNMQRTITEGKASAPFLV